MPNVGSTRGQPTYRPSSYYDDAIFRHREAMRAIWDRHRAELAKILSYKSTSTPLPRRKVAA